MYVKLCYKSLTFKNKKSNCNINISKVLHLPFYMLYYFLKSMMVQFKMY